MANRPVARRWKRAGIAALARIVPALYLAYMRLVLATGRVVRIGMEEMLADARGGANIAIAMLHQDIMPSAILFRDLGIVTVANVGDAGDIISAVMERCGVTVVRGGSSSRPSRRTPVLGELIARINERARAGAGGAIWAVTPDGSRGPAGAVKRGVAAIAIETGSKVYCLKIHASRALYAPTWDRTTIPLPFGTIHIELDGPISAGDSSSPAAVETLRCEVEKRLHAVHARAFARMGRRPIPELTALDAVAAARAQGGGVLPASASRG